MRIMSAALTCLFGAGLLMGTAGCSGDETKTEKSSPPVAGGITLTRAEVTTIPEMFEVSGTVRARNSSTISARIAGTVTGIFVREGDRVRRGSRLLTLESGENTAGAAEAAFAVEEASRAVEEALTKKKLADLTFARFARLYEEQAVTRQEFDTRKAERDMAEQGLARARARLSRADESARAAGTIAGYTRVTAPFSGLVTGKSVDVGTTVFPGMPLMTVEEEGNYRLEVNVPETLRDRVKTGQTVPVSIDGAAGTSTGKIAEVLPTIDPLSRTFIVKIDTGTPGMRSGMYGRALLPAGEKKGLTVPQAAVLQRGQLTFVWVADPQNIARLRLVKPGASRADRVEILAGLREGDMVVVSGADKVTDGVRIE